MRFWLDGNGIEHRVGLSMGLCRGLCMVCPSVISTFCRFITMVGYCRFLLLVNESALQVL